MCFVLSRSVISDSLQPHGLQSTRLLCSWGFSTKERWGVEHALLQAIVPTQGLNPGLLNHGWILYHLSRDGSKDMGRGSEQTFFHIRYTDDQQIHEMVLNITYYPGNANQNHNESTSHLLECLLSK